MKPEHEARRKIIREWMSLPKDKRQTEEQAKPFAKKAMERIPSSGDPYRQILRCLPASVSRDRVIRSLTPRSYCANECGQPWPGMSSNWAEFQPATPGKRCPIDS